MTLQAKSANTTKAELHSPSRKVEMQSKVLLQSYRHLRLVMTIRGACIILKDHLPASVLVPAPAPGAGTFKFLPQPATAEPEFESESAPAERMRIY